MRSATAADVPALVALVNAAYRGDSSRIGWTTEADLLDGQRVDADGLAAALATPGIAVLIAEKEPAVLLGCVQLHRWGSDCYLGLLTIEPAAQGAGLGSRHDGHRAKRRAHRVVRAARLRAHERTASLPLWGRAFRPAAARRPGARRAEEATGVNCGGVRLGR